MSIRRLRLDSDSDEEQQNTLPPQTVTVTHQPSNASTFPPESVDISDDDEFIDVSDSLSPPSPQPQPVPGSPVANFLPRLGLALKRDWLASCLCELQASVTGFEGLDVAAKAKLCFEQFLFADMNFCGSGVLPPNVDSMHLSVLPGPYVLQVDEIINISCPLRSRYEQAPPGLKRCLKLSLTDGVQRVFGMEYRPIQALEVCASSGLKVAISNVRVHRGLLMLVPETIEILGGLVEQLDAARKQLVEELNKPPRGKRTKNGVFPPLATRATLAAWPSSGVDDIGQSGSTLHSTDSIQANSQGAGLSISGTGNIFTTDDTFVMGAQNSASNSIPHMLSNAEAMNINMHGDINPMSRANSMANQFSSIISEAEDMHIDVANVSREDSVDNQSSHMRSNVAAAHKDTVHTTRESSGATECPPVVENVETSRDRINLTTDNALPRRSSSTISNTSDIQMVDGSDCPVTVSGVQEVPFTYLASLSAKWVAMKEKAPSIQGKIKCFLTGVKGFQYKKRTTYELLAYVDDGSLISEILIDHDVVQKGIGYSAQEVTAALSSPDTNVVHNMKDTMRKFQTFLANFEGVILVELNRKSSLPLALDMNQGCPQSDAWLLLRRLKTLYPAQVQTHFPSDPIELSP
ncbi:recQ-mediated genome instability protein 1-like [Abrus precatorius]|uniref:RecQ-mediated genome instability protein 1 n=1 Tax=Abrus precatorius TaxID=3816 RepID=A0A8B8K9B5_ABRPR|nr:recQ-mediated genome instability protein 1-like [Abrus precatorius]